MLALLVHSQKGKSDSDMSTPYIAIVITAYNVKDYVERCIHSIQQQTYSNWKIYIVDDGSKDNTLAIVKRMAKSDNRIIVKHTENQGTIAARKTGIDMIENCKYVMFVDSDDYIIGDTLFEDSVTKMESEDIDVLCFNYLHSGSNGFSADSEIVFSSKGETIKSMICRTAIDGNMPYSVYKTESVKKTFQIRSCNNDDFLNKYAILMDANRVVYEPWVGYFYYVNENSQTHRMIREEDYIYYEHVKEFSIEVQKEYPNLVRECEYFELWVLLWLGVNILKKSGCRTHPLYDRVIPSIKRLTMKYYLNSHFTKKEKVNVLLISLNMFSFVYRKYHSIKRSRV